MSRPVELSPWHTHFCKIRPAHGCKAALRARLPLLTPPTPPPPPPRPSGPRAAFPQNNNRPTARPPEGRTKGRGGQADGAGGGRPAARGGGGTGGPCLPRPRTPPPPWAPTSGRGDAAQHRAPPCPPTVPSHPRDPSGGGSVLTPTHTHRSAQGIPAGPPPSPPPQPPPRELAGAKSRRTARPPAPRGTPTSLTSSRGGRWGSFSR